VDYSDTVALFRTIPIFATMDVRSLKVLAYASSHLAVEPGDALCYQGEAADSVYIIVDGQAEVVVGRQGKDVRVATVGRYEVVGEIAVLLNQRRTATVRAITPGRVLKIDAETFISAVTGHPDAALSVMRTLCRRIVSLLPGD
jgi:CRP-like cAMP-binding protein